MTRPPKMPASAIRSMVESRNAPQVPLVPFSRASTPSSMSRNTKIVQVKAPGNSSPMGKRASAPPATPTVPMTVTAFGVIGVRARTLPAGVNRRVMAGRTTVSDFDETEVRQQRSVNLTLAPIIHNGIKVNLLDTPGYADFTGDLRAGLRAADSALFAVSATDGIDGVTRMLWEECAAVGMPRAVVITKIDHQRAEFQATLDACREAFGDAVAPLYLPVGEPVTGLIGLLSQKLYSYSGGQRSEGAPAAADEERMTDLRGELIEGIITESEDESLMDRYQIGRAHV